MIRVVVGLGNPGQQYEKTRHNVGYWFNDRLASRLSGKWSVEKRFNGRLASVDIGGHKVYLLKPDTYMNLSGQSVFALLKYYDLNIAECLVVHDELDFEAGVVRLKQGGGHAGHNGLKSIISCFGNSDFLRLRLGVGRPKGQSNVADYVLSAPSKVDAEKIEIAIERGVGCIEAVVSGLCESVMRKLHE